MKRWKPSSRMLRFGLWLYPPLLGAGIRVRRVSAHLREIDVEMKQRWWNVNYVGTHYGGSLYSMTDPFYMIMLLHNLGRDYIVWDKSASIRFRKPGKGTVRAEFRLDEQQLAQLRAQLREQERIEPTFAIDVLDAAGEVVARVEKVIHIRNKDARASEAGAQPAA